MKKSMVVLIIVALVIVTTILWVINSRIPMGLPEILVISVLFISIGFGIFIGINRITSLIKKEPADDEMSRKILTKSSSWSFYGSIYMWLVLMYFSDKTKLETHSMIGAGILGMAIIFFLSWVGVKIFGLKNE
jgi:hypothetical protein